jgi:hypothetical protein
MPDKNLEYIYGLIWDWSKAKAAVKPNAQLIVESNFDTVVMEACARHMKIFQTCEAALIELTGRQGLPSALVRYLEARADTACGTCWTSSSMPQHPECQKKIDKFFKTEDELFRFAMQCDPAKT